MVIEPATGPSTSAVIQRPPDLSSMRGFGDSDIAANEAGRLSPSQRSLLRGQQLRNLVALPILVVWTFLSWRSGGPWVFVVVGGGTILWFAYTWARDLLAIYESVVDQVEGTAWIEEKSDGETSSWVMHMEALDLNTTQEVYKNFEAGGPYRAFYVPRTRRLVSARPLAGWAASPPRPEKKHRFPFSIDIGF